MSKTLHIQKIKKRIDGLIARPFTVKASRTVDRLLLKIMEAGNEQ